MKKMLITSGPDCSAKSTEPPQSGANEEGVTMEDFSNIQTESCTEIVDLTVDTNASSRAVLENCKG